MIGAELIGAYSAAGLAVIGAVFGYGKLNQKVSDMGKEIQSLKDTRDKMSDRLSDGAVAFAEIREGLKVIREGQTRVEGVLEKMSGRLDVHIDGGNGR